MLIAQWVIVLPKEKLDDFLRFWKEKIKPFWEAHGCTSASIYQSVDAQYFSYQIMEDSATITEQLSFDSREGFKKFLKFNEENREADEITGSYEKLFMGTDTKFRVFEKV
jgi:hypothetical protein